MKRSHLYLTTFTVLLLLQIVFGADPANTIKYNGKDYYINGINVPWNAFGSDVGMHYQWGACYDPAFFTTFFQECKSAGINCVRLWIHCDGRSSPEFDDNGFVTGLDTNFLSNFDDILRIADGNNVMVMPCLWSFDMTKDFTSTAGKYAGLHADLIQDSIKSRSYVDKALIPMVKHLANSSNLFAWEVINEPEWSIKGPGTTVQLVSDKEMVRFCGMIAEAIHENSNKMVTVGSACLKWHSSRQGPAEAHYWSDSSFQAAYKNPKAYLDFYQIHYYDWMWNPDWGYDPFQETKTPAYWKLDKPTIIGEWPAVAGNYTVKQMVDAAYTNGYAGVMPWSYNAKDGFGTWESCKAELKAFRDAHASIVDFTGGSTNVKDRQNSVTISLKNGFPNTDALTGGINLSLFDISGKKLGTYSASTASKKLPTTNGLLLYQVRDNSNRVIISGKTVDMDVKKR